MRIKSFYKYFYAYLRVFGDRHLIYSEVKILPNAKVLEQKQQIVADLKADIENSVAGVVKSLQ